jgi:hypothetical protein
MLMYILVYSTSALSASSCVFFLRIGINMLILLKKRIHFYPGFNNSFINYGEIMAVFYNCVIVLSLAIVLEAMNRTIENCFSRSYVQFYYRIYIFFLNIYNVIFNLLRQTFIKKQTFDLIIFVLSWFQCLLLPITSVTQVIYFIFILHLRLLINLLNCFATTSKFITSQIKQMLIIHIMTIPTITVLLLMFVNNKLSNFVAKILTFIIFTTLAVCQCNLGPFRVSGHRQSQLFKLSQMLNFTFLFILAIYTTFPSNTLNISVFFLSFISFFTMLLLFTSLQILPTCKIDQYKTFLFKVFIPLLGILFISTML